MPSVLSLVQQTKLYSVHILSLAKSLLIEGKADFQRYYLPDSCHFFFCRYGHTCNAAERALVYSGELELAMPS